MVGAVYSPFGRGGALKPPTISDPIADEVDFVCFCLGSWNVSLIRLRLPVEGPFPFGGCFQPLFCIVVRATRWYTDKLAKQDRVSYLYVLPSWEPKPLRLYLLGSCRPFCAFGRSRGAPLRASPCALGGSFCALVFSPFFPS